jgi:quinone-modifying oxidoreductase subunit QmoC
VATAITLSPSRAFRAELLRRGGSGAARCYQCATCSAACDLATSEMAFPRRQMLWLQWGLVDRIAADPAVWLCHDCSDCSARCPRDARPGDAMQAIRSLLIEELGSPRPMARLVSRAATTWPLLLGLPVIFWALYVWAVNGFAVPRTPLAFADVVPVWMIYSVFLPAGAFALLASALGARRSWAAWGQGGGRQGSVWRGLGAVAWDILAHRRFRSCRAARPRRTGHLLLLWGFAGALATTTLLGIAMDVFGVKTPLPQLHPIKILGNLSAVLLAVGLVWLVVHRAANKGATAATQPFDTFFAVLLALLVFSGIGAELARQMLPARSALAVYLLHLGAVLTLFLTFPFSKFAHALYRTLAMAHERLTVQRRQP